MHLNMYGKAIEKLHAKLLPILRERAPRETPGDEIDAVARLLATVLVLGCEYGQADALAGYLLVYNQRIARAVELARSTVARLCGEEATRGLGADPRFTALILAEIVKKCMGIDPCRNES